MHAPTRKENMSRMRRFALFAVPAALASGLLAASLANQSEAQTAPAAQPGMFTGSKEPLDVTSDNGEQFQQDHRAVWYGNVEVRQGTSRMRTPRLNVFFTPPDPNKPKAAPGAIGADPGQVERIEAEGPVYYVTPTQSAKGDHATYISADDTITMTGNVVLVQGKNVATGDKLVIQQKTGHSTLSTLPGKASPQRVRAVLYPNQTTPGAAPTPSQPPKSAGKP
jgi:lipopolysaccharide export system protein LptA